MRSRPINWRTFLAGILLLLFACLVNASGQTTPATTTPVVGHFTNADGSVYSGGLQLRFQLIGCPGGVPRVLGSNNMILNQLVMIPDTTGTVTGTIWPNDVLNCAGQTGTSSWNVQRVVNNVPQGPPQCFHVLLANGLHLDTDTPCPAVNAGTAPGVARDGTFANLVALGNQDVYGTQHVRGNVLIDGTLTATVQNLGLQSVNANVNGELNVMMPFYGVWGDNQHDDTVALNAVMNTARAQHLAVYLPAATYLISAPIDMRLLHVRGAGMYMTTLRMQPGVQKSVMLISLNTTIQQLGGIGGWDGVTKGGAGYCIEATTSEPGSTAQLPYHMNVLYTSCQNTYGSSGYFIDAAYTLLEGNDWHNSGGRAILDIDSHDNPNIDGFGPTTISAIANTFSDTYQSKGYGIYDNDCVNCRFAYNVMENTAGGYTTGPQNRALDLEGNYEENTSTGLFWDFSTSAGLGLNMTGSRGGPMAGPLPAHLVNWADVNIKGNWFQGPSFGDSGFASTVRSVSSFFDPIVAAPGEYIFNPGAQTSVSSPVLTNAGGWSAILKGTFVDFTGGVVANPPLMIVTSANPTIGIGHVSLTFSMASGGYLQGTVSSNCCGATTLRFTGWIEVYNDRNHAGPAAAILTPAPISAGSFSTGSGAASTTACTPNGYKPFTIDGVTYHLATCP